MKAKLWSRFTLKSENTGRKYQLIVDVPYADATDATELHQDMVYDFIQNRNLEIDYGVFDGYENPANEEWGFSSYEIEEDKFFDLLDLFQDEFKRNGYEAYYSKF